MCHLSKEIKKQTEIPKTKTFANIEFIKIPHIYEVKDNVDYKILPKIFMTLKKSESEIRTFFKPITPPPKVNYT